MRNSTLASNTARERRRRFRLGTLFLALAFCAGSVAAQTPTLPPGASAGPCHSGICEYTLRNSTRVLLMPDPAAPKTTVNVVYRVGSLHEGRGESGMAHLLEHLLFKGTPRHPNIPNELKKRGIDYNATTNPDHTNYYGTFANDDAVLSWLLEMEADRMVNAFIAKKDLDSEMTVVRNEFESAQNSPQIVLDMQVRAAAFNWHNYGKSVLGARSDIENVPIQALQAFYRTWYRPDNATVIVAGGIDPTRTLERIDRSFGAIPRPAAPIPALYTEEPTQIGERVTTVRMVAGAPLLTAAYRVPSVGHPDMPALSLLANILASGERGRAYRRLSAMNAAMLVFGGVDGRRDPGLLTVRAMLHADSDIDRARDALLEEIEAVAQRPITADELERSKALFEMAEDMVGGSVNEIALELQQAIGGGDWRLWAASPQRIAEVDLEQVNRVARTYLKPANRTLGVLIPTAQPDRAEYAAAPPLEETLNALRETPADQGQEVFDPSPANIEQRIQRFVLGEHLRVTFLPKKTRGGKVEVNAHFRFGNGASLSRFSPIASAAVGNLLSQGTEGFSEDDMTDRRLRLRMNGRIDTGPQYARTTFSTKREYLRESLELVARQLKHPSFPADALEKQRRQALGAAREISADPEQQVNLALESHFDTWPDGDPRKAMTTERRVALWGEIDREALLAFHRAHYGTAYGDIAIVGDFDPAEARALLQRVFLAWRSPAPYARELPPQREVPARRLHLRTPDRANANIAARMPLTLNEDDRDYPALVVANRVLGGGALQSRLGTRIRQREGLSYQVGSWLSAGRWHAATQTRDEQGALDIEAITAPQNVERVETAIREEFERFVRDGISAHELNDAVGGLLEMRKQERAEDNDLAALLARQSAMGRTMAWEADFDARLRALTADAVNATIRRHLKPETLSVFAAGDFPENAETPKSGRSE